MPTFTEGVDFPDDMPSYTRQAIEAVGQAYLALGGGRDDAAGNKPQVDLGGWLAEVLATANRIQFNREEEDGFGWGFLLREGAWETEHVDRLISGGHSWVEGEQY